MPNHDKELAKLTAQWEKTDRLWKKAAKKYQEAIVAYQWSMSGDRAKWARIIVLRMREAIAFRKAETAHQMLVDFMQSSPDRAMSQS